MKYRVFDILQDKIKLVLLFNLLFCLGLISCMSLHTHQTAKVLSPGANEASMAIGHYKSDFIMLGEDDAYSFPYMAVHYRRGVLANFDFGLHMVNLLTVYLDLKLQLIQGKSALALGLVTGYGKKSTGVYSTRFIDFAFPVYLTYDFNSMISSTLIPELIFRSIKEAEDIRGQRTTQLLWGGRYNIRVGEKWGVSGECSYFKVLKDAGTAPILEFSIAMFWDWNDHNENPEDISDLKLLESYSEEEYNFLKE